MPQELAEEYCGEGTFLYAPEDALKGEHEVSEPPAVMG
jgi:hypothetical protein